MGVDIGIVRVERFIDAVGCVFYGQISHGFAPAAIRLALNTCFSSILEMSASIVDNLLDDCLSFENTLPQQHDRLSSGHWMRFGLL
jgi:hypothetical protein